MQVTRSIFSLPRDLLYMLLKASSGKHSCSSLLPPGLFTHPQHNDPDKWLINVAVDGPFVLKMAKDAPFIWIKGGDLAYYSFYDWKCVLTVFLFFSILIMNDTDTELLNNFIAFSYIIW